MAAEDESDAAAARLEDALERIARLARRPEPLAGGTQNAEIAARLDGLIARLRQVLASQGKGAQFGGIRLPVAVQAILFDLMNGGEKDWIKAPMVTSASTAYITAATAIGIWPSLAQAAGPTTTKTPRRSQKQPPQPDDERTSVLPSTLP